MNAAEPQCGPIHGPETASRDCFATTALTGDTPPSSALPWSGPADSPQCTQQLAAEAPASTPASWRVPAQAVGRVQGYPLASSAAERTKGAGIPGGVGGHPDASLHASEKADGVLKHLGTASNNRGWGDESPGEHCADVEDFGHARACREAGLSMRHETTCSGAQGVACPPPQLHQESYADACEGHESRFLAVIQTGAPDRCEGRPDAPAKRFRAGESESAEKWGASVGASIGDLGHASWATQEGSPHPVSCPEDLRKREIAAALESADTSHPRSTEAKADQVGWGPGLEGSRGRALLVSRIQTGLDAPLLVPDLQGADLDPEVVAALPEDIQREIRLSYMALSGMRKAGTGGGVAVRGRVAPLSRSRGRGVRPHGEAQGPAPGLARFLVPKSVKRPKR